MIKLFAFLILITLPLKSEALNLRNSPMKGMLQFKSMCLDYDFIEKSLKKGKETRTLVLATHTGDVIEIWTSIKKETWTVISRSAKLNLGCVLAVGTGVFYETNNGI
jgi:hypothetical protein|tara:strand:- start:6480 stop:6800 length:321 start_codon:yes stop_codon:yes gene_type:complete